MKKENRINRVMIDRGAENYAHTSRILRIIKDVRVERAASEDMVNADNRDMMDLDKRTLRLVPFKGALFKPCPGTKEYICCGYQILHIGTNCPLDCSYCILQAYFNQPSLRVFVNLEDELSHIGQIIDSNPERIFRVGTGEFTDSLALDAVTGWSSILSHFMLQRKNAILEFKTKSDHIEKLCSSSTRDRVIVSWSLNSSEVALKEEHGAPSIKKRLEAARRCQSEGYILGFHFDPLIHYPNWKEGYLRTIEMLDHYIDPKGIIWLSLGCLRYMPGLKRIIRKRHPYTHILDGEFIRGLDGKKRYFKPIRMEMYAWTMEIIEGWSSDLGLYLCMESDEVWKKSMRWSPGDSDGLSRYLDNRVRRFFNTPNGSSI